MTVPNITLNNSVEIPQLGFGVFLIPPDETESATATALEVGYRHIDTAQMYRNEAEVARGISKAAIEPSSVFVTSKLSNAAIGFDAALTGFDDTLAAMGFERIDLYLIHWPLPTVRDFVETWRAFERIYAEGRVRAIGVSNFQPAHLDRLRTECETVPAVNQIEAHPYFPQDALRAYDESNGIATEAWAPLARGAIASDPLIAEVAATHGKTPAQVALRWHIQLGNIVFPKTMSRARMEENFAIFDFVLSDEDMARIATCSRNGRTGPDPDTFAPSS